MRPTESTASAELSGLDRLELPLAARRGLVALTWSALWPPLAAIALLLVAWQTVVATGWRPAWVLPGPLEVIPRLVGDLLHGDLLLAIGITLRRATVGFALAVVIGTLVGLAIVRWRPLRSAIGALITGLQTMPSIAWFPLAILLFGLTEQAILFVVVLGAAPSVANGLIHGVDQIPRILLRAGRVLGARGIDAYRFVIVPAATPAFVGGLKQAWAFAWRSLMAGELLVVISGLPSLGVRLQFARELSDSQSLLATMLVVLVVGVVIDLLLFGTLQRVVRRRWGLASDG